jgi:hypothetical protein
MTCFICPSLHWNIKPPTSLRIYITKHTKSKERGINALLKYLLTNLNKQWKELVTPLHLCGYSEVKRKVVCFVLCPQVVLRTRKQRIQQQEGFPKNQEIFEKFFEHAVYRPGGRHDAVFEGTIVARTRTLKDIKGPPESKLIQYLQSEGVLVTVKRFKTIKLKNIVFFYKLSPEFTFRPIFEAALKDEFEETLNAEEEDTGPDVPEIELRLKIVWAKEPKTKREAKAKCMEVICEERRHATCLRTQRLKSPSGWTVLTTLMNNGKRGGQATGSRLYCRVVGYSIDTFSTLLLPRYATSHLYDSSARRTYVAV